MSPLHREHSLAEHYDQTLRLTRFEQLPEGQPRPQPTSTWPKENIELYERYRDFLLSGGASEHSAKVLYLPVAGYVLGLNLKPHGELDLDKDLERVTEYVLARKSCQQILKTTRNGLNKFRRFLRIERGLGEAITTTPFDVAGKTAGLPVWLASELERYLRIQQRNWRAARLQTSIRNFWGKHQGIWRFLCLERGVQQLSDVKRQLVLEYVDRRLATGHAVAGVNSDLRYFRSFLLFLQDEGYAVPQALLRIPGLKTPDALPKYLTDEQVRAVRDEFERCVRESRLASLRRRALLDRAAFYLLWQGGLRVGEVEELRLEDLDFPGRKLSVRNGKGLKDRTIYLSDTVVRVVGEYLAVRGMGNDDHVFLHRNVPLKRHLIQIRLKAVGEKVGVHLYPHRLRHTCATQLLNAGCRITSIQRFLGHKKLNTTMIYARAHDQTVADDYFAAMQRVEKRLEIAPQESKEDENVREPQQAQMLVWVEQLAQPELCFPARLEIVAQLRQALGWVAVSAEVECKVAQVSEHPPPLPCA